MNTDENAVYLPIVVKIPPKILRSDEWYHDLCQYVARKTGMTWVDELYDGDGAYGDAYYRDDDGRVWCGALNGPTNYDGTRDYLLEFDDQ